MLGPFARLRAALHDDCGTARVLVVPLAVALLLASTAAAVPLSSSGPGATTTAPIVGEQNTTARLVLPEDADTTSGFATVRVDVAGATAVETARIHGRYQTIRLREAFGAAETEAAQRAVVESATADLAARINELEQRQATALTAYAAGELSTEALVRELAAVHAAADSAEGTLRQLYTFDRAAGKPVSESEVAQLKARLVPLQGPVRGRLAGSMGENRVERVHVTAADNGIILSTVVESDFSTQYLREAFYADGFDDRFADRPISFDEFQTRMEERYTWVFDQNPPIDTVLTSEPFYVRAGVYGIAINHPHGTVSERDLVVYYDAGTDEVFYEIQRKDVTTVPTNPLGTTTEGDLRLELRSTHPGGPLRVDVTNAVTGDPVTATVLVNGDPVGETQEGRLWTVAPEDTVVVTAETPNENVSITNI
jgi:hypothetical protein